MGPSFISWYAVFHGSYSNGDRRNYWHLASFCDYHLLEDSPASEQALPLNGSVEVDELDFAAQGVRGRHGRGAYGKTIIFRLLKRQGMGTMAWSTSEMTRISVNYGAKEFAAGERHINGIESFLSYTKRGMVKFNGLTKRSFYLHFKEAEFRFNHMGDNHYLAILKTLRLNPL